MPSNDPKLQAGLAPESALMKALRAAGRDDLAWSLRRLHVPVPEDALVLEVGSGGNPFPRSNVLVDAYEETGERHFEPLVADRPCLLARGERLPFRDGAFDFVIACHVLEHSDDPAAFLAEQQRVARAGYIETPDALFERLIPYRDHRWEVTLREGALLLRRKRAWRHDPEVSELFEGNLRASRPFARHLRTNPFAFHVRYYWSREAGGIRYRLIDTPGPREPIPEGASAPQPAPRPTLRRRAIEAARSVFSQRRRNRAIDLLSLLRCPGCAAAPLTEADGALLCPGCGQRYRRSGALVDLTLPAP
jgi:SAM-dependent methyltransferase